MRNPFKSLKKSIKSAWAPKPSADIMFGKSPIHQNHEHLLRIWPDGTWTMLESAIHTGAEGDFLARQVLESGFHLEQEGKIRTELGLPAGMPLPGMFNTAVLPIPPDWLPSRQLIKELFSQEFYEKKYETYMIAMLDQLGHIRA